jgi:hypothetical protein
MGALVIQQRTSLSELCRARIERACNETTKRRIDTFVCTTRTGRHEAVLVIGGAAICPRAQKGYRWHISNGRTYSLSSLA